MTITELKQTVPERFIVKFDDGTQLKTTLNAVADLGLYSGRELTAEEFLEIKASSELSLCKARALRIIGARPMSRAEIYKRLTEKGELPENAENTVIWLQEMGLLDDEAYAAMIVRHYSAKGYGKRRVQGELYRRGLDRSLWESALNEMPEMDEKIDKFLRQKLKSDEPDRAELKKATDALARRGYSWDEISAAVRRFRNGDNHYE